VTRRAHTSELEITATVARLLDQFAGPDWDHTHFPAGEKRPKPTANRLKSMGLKPGWPDFVLIGPDGRHYYLEIKRHDGLLSQAQFRFMNRRIAQGVPYAVARSSEEAIDILARWGAVKGVRVAA
jgi:VRR-NUC domain